MLDKNNPTGLQAATQTMANALAQQHADASEYINYLGMLIYGIDSKTDRLVTELAPWDENTTVAGAAPETGGGDAAVGA